MGRGGQKKTKETLDGVGELILVCHRWETCQGEDAISDCHPSTDTQRCHRCPRRAVSTGHVEETVVGQVQKLLTPWWT